MRNLRWVVEQVVDRNVAPGFVLGNCMVLRHPGHERLVPGPWSEAEVAWSGHLTPVVIVPEEPTKASDVIERAVLIPL